MNVMKKICFKSEQGIKYTKKMKVTVHFYTMQKNEKL